MSNLNAADLIVSSFKEGLKNFPKVLVNFVLWVLTIWIPYINIGTTIAIATGLPLKISKGGELSFTEVFNPVYREKMSQYFIVTSLLSICTSIGAIFVFVPGIVLGIAWCIADLLVIDQDKKPIEAMYESAEKTKGKKMMIFLVYLAVSIVLMLAILIITKILFFLGTFLISLILLALYGAACSIIISIRATLYKTL